MFAYVHAIHNYDIAFRFMEMIHNVKCVLPFFAAMAILVCGCTTTQISRFELETSEAPEVSGPNRYLEPKTTTYRLFGTLKLDKNEDIAVSGKYRDWDADTLAKVKTFFANGIYHMGGFEGTGGFELYKKSDNAVYGLGIGYNDGIYHHITYGFNFQHFEFGSYLGFFHQYMHVKYSGSSCSGVNTCLHDNEDFNEDKNVFESSLFWGLYAGVFIGDFFLNYSLSGYTPGLDTDDESVSTPTITSNYFTLGYHINKNFAVSVGAVGSDVASHWHWAGSCGIHYYR